MLSGGIRRLTLIALLGTSGLATPALAQQADNATVDDNAIIVTAQRRAEALEDVPMTVSVLNQETLTNLGVSSVRDLANVTSGLQLANSGSYPQPAIRGITTINAGNYENNVALFVDGLYQTTAQVLNMDLPNVQNIQVLKGPQGTLYGRNATGGAILIDTIDPGDELAGSVEVGYGRFDDRRARGYIAGPVTDKIGLSIAGTYRKTGGYYKLASRTTPGAFDGRTLGLDQQSLRAKLVFDVTETFKATVGYSFLRASDPRGVLFTAIENINTSYVDNPATPYLDGNATRPRGLGEVAGDVFDLDLKQHEGSLKLEWETGIGTLRSLTGYTAGKLDTTYDADGTYSAGTYSDSQIHDTTWQEALDLTIDAIENVDLIVGGTYYNIQTKYAPDRANVAFLAVAPNNIPGTPLSSYRRLQEIFFWRTKEALSGFVDATIHLGDKLSINLGGRYSSETQDVEAKKNNFCTVAAGCTVAGVGTVAVGAITTTPYDNVPGNAIPDAINKSKYKKFTPRASIRYEFMPGTNVYASYSKGFRSGEWNSVPPSDTNLALWPTEGEIGQESVDAFEVGLKHAGDKLRFELSAFYYDYKDLQLATTVFVGGLAVVSLQSVPKAKVRGLEASFEYEPIDNLKIRGGATYLHARYGDRAVFVASSINTAGTGFNVNSDPLRVLPNLTQVAQDLSGKQMARAPNFSAYFGADYFIPMGDGGLRFAANVKYTDSYAVTEPTIFGGERLTIYQCKNGTQTGAACAGIPFVGADYLPDNNSTLAGSPYVGRANEQRARQGKYALLSGSITWTDKTDHLFVRVWGTNLTNVIYRANYRPSGTTWAPIAEPRTYGATVGYKF